MPFDVALLEELGAHQISRPLLDLPGLRDRRQIAHGHAHRTQQLPRLVRTPVAHRLRRQHQRQRRQRRRFRHRHSRRSIGANAHTADRLQEGAALAEVHSQIGGQDGVLEHMYHLAVVVRRQIAQHLIAGTVEDHQALVEMVVLHRRRGVQLRQRRRCSAGVAESSKGGAA